TDESPVTQVSWNDACAYCAWLSGKEGCLPAYRTDGKGGWLISAEADGYRLPTEAEWEYACRAGTTTQYSFGENWRRLIDYPWFSENGVAHHWTVGLKPSNPFGLFDMHGNVGKWAQDWHDDKWYEKSPASDPMGPSLGSARIVRGGYWSNLA